MSQSAASPASTLMDHQQHTEEVAPAIVSPSLIQEHKARPAAQSRVSHAANTTDSEGHGALERYHSRMSHMSQEESNDLMRRLTSRRSAGGEDPGGDNTFNELLGEIFDRDEMKKKNVGVYFEDLNVIGGGVGAAIQPTVGDILKGIASIPILPYVIYKSTKAKSPEAVERKLIHGFNGCVKDGEMLLVLGQPGSGCTTFLKALANQRNGYKEVTGNVHYGGIGWEEMAKKYRGDVVYNSEDDLHFATLSVEQTLRFALKTRTPGERPQGETRKGYQDKFLNVLGKIFGIEHTFKTKVGDEMVRGVSGGEKKRVSIAEVFVNRASVGCWDNSTRGLDASTAVEYCRSLRVLTNIAKVSTVVTIYQAGEQLYDFFDKVLLIEGGRCLYYGPAESARQYFIDMGYEPEERQTTADFLTAITDKRARKERDGASPPQTTEELEQYYKSSQICKDNFEDMKSYNHRCKEDPPAETFKETESDKKGKRHGVYALPFYKQIWYCTIRQYQINFGDKLSLYGKNASAVFQALIIGSLFYDMPKDTNGAFLRGGVIFFSLLFNALLALAELSSAFSSRPVLMKHKSFTFFRPSAFALAQVVADVPVVLLQVAAFDIVIYFLSGLQYTASQFFINYLFLYFSTMAVYSFFRMLGALVPSLDAATALSGIAIQALVVYAGYIIPRPSMHPWLYWLWYINPLAYGFESMMINEFYNLDLECVVPRLLPYGAPGQFPNQGCAIAGSTPGSTVVSGAAYISESFTYVRGHLWRNLAFIIMFWLFFIFVTCVGTERQKPNASAGGSLVYKRGGEPKAVKEALGGEKEVDAAQEAQAAHVEQHDGSDSDSTMDGFEKSETTFTWSDVCYNVPDPANKGHQKQLLDHVTGWVKPGQLTCLVGSSGAGKTTLLNTLAQRQTTGVVTGDMLVDGRKLPSAFQRATGYVQQMDMHEPTATVREALQFSAHLRQPRETPQAEKYAYVEEIIKLLEMEHMAEAVIGVPGNGLTIEQRKRVTLGVELAAKPSLLLFLDEPTSGLDSQAAWNIVRFLKKLANAGQAILVTIHQPSSILFQQFERILLLGPGGQTIYFGELGDQSKTMIKYFTSNGAEDCPEDANPAEWVLDVIGAGGGIGAKKAKQDWPQIWRDSRNAQDTRSEIERIRRERGGKANKFEQDTRKYAMPVTAQTGAVVKRIFVSYWRTPDFFIGKLMLHITTGLFNCFTFFQLGNSVVDLQNRIFSIFLVLTIAPPLMQQLQPRYLQWRALFQGREQQSRMYSSWTFALGSILVELPYTIACATIFFFCWYFGPGFDRSIGRAGPIWMFLALFEIYYVTLGIMIASIAKTELFASLLVPTFFTFIIAFCGVLSPPSSIITFWQWVYHLTPFNYLLSAMLIFVVHDKPVRCAASEFARFAPLAGQTCQEYAGSFVQQAAGYLQDPNATDECLYCQYATGDEYAATLLVYWGDRWRNYGIFWAYVIFNILITFVFTWLYCGGFAKIGAKLKRSGHKRVRKDSQLREADEESV
ncbi:putative ABC transporter [Protomyces lactucae-debilis]|uniref:Putative ABC transporter n=1 Tax=Protomyces lactucae-debilis TaxID=2754530 RepID=A0A1Y2FQ90_PROLT|nr:putative ABC transporter [Protomyces lactucae-debilis]ORY85494.1 putative ABC transporter [Protomyces lactucae-debilis]